MGPAAYLIRGPWHKKLQYISEIMKTQTKENCMELYTKLCFNNAALKLVPLLICFPIPSPDSTRLYCGTPQYKTGGHGKCSFMGHSWPSGRRLIKSMSIMIPSLLKDNQEWLNRCCHKCTSTVDESPGANRHSRLYKEVWPNTMQASEYAKKKKKKKRKVCILHQGKVVFFA